MCVGGGGLSEGLVGGGGKCVWCFDIHSPLRISLELMASSAWLFLVQVPQRTHRFTFLLKCLSYRGRQTWSCLWRDNKKKPCSYFQTVWVKSMKMELVAVWCQAVKLCDEVAICTAFVRNRKRRTGSRDLCLLHESVTFPPHCCVWG